MIGARKSSRDDHHVDFLEHAIDIEREHRELSRSPARTKGGYTQLTDEPEPAMPHGYTKPNSADISRLRDPESDNVHGGLDAVGTLDLHVISGANLLSADSNGLSDPFVKVRLHGQGGKDLHRAETAVVKKTLSPQWDKRFLT